MYMKKEKNRVIGSSLGKIRWLQVKIGHICMIQTKHNLPIGRQPVQCNVTLRFPLKCFRVNGKLEEFNMNLLKFFILPTKLPDCSGERP